MKEEDDDTSTPNEAEQAHDIQDLTENTHRPSTSRLRDAATNVGSEQVTPLGANRSTDPKVTGAGTGSKPPPFNKPMTVIEGMNWLTVSPAISPQSVIGDRLSPQPAESSSHQVPTTNTGNANTLAFPEIAAM